MEFTLAVVVIETGQDVQIHLFDAIQPTLNKSARFLTRGRRIRSRRPGLKSFCRAFQSSVQTEEIAVASRFLDAKNIVDGSALHAQRKFFAITFGMAAVTWIYAIPGIRSR